MLLIANYWWRMGFCGTLCSQLLLYTIDPNSIMVFFDNIQDPLWFNPHNISSIHVNNWLNRYICAFFVGWERVITKISLQKSSKFNLILRKEVEQTVDNKTKRLVWLLLDMTSIHRVWRMEVTFQSHHLDTTPVCTFRNF